MKNLKFLFATVLTVCMSSGLFAQIDMDVPGGHMSFNTALDSDIGLKIFENSSTPTALCIDGNNASAPSILIKKSGNNKVNLRYLETGSTKEWQTQIKPNSGGLRSVLRINRDEQVMIGHETKVPINKDFILAVGGKLVAEEIKVALQLGDWPDYVFTPEYQLTPLAELEAQIKELGHLPNIPSAEEVEANGFLLGEMDAMLLEKIEELTIHLIDLNKEVQAVKAENAQLKANK